MLQSHLIFVKHIMIMFMYLPFYALMNFVQLQPGY